MLINKFKKKEKIINDFHYKQLQTIQNFQYYSDII